MDVNGQPIQLDQQQKKILQEFRVSVEDCQLPNSGDAYLLSWLVARNFDKSQAEQMLRTSLEWRKANQVDGILDNWKPPEVMDKYFPLGIYGHDKFGCPVVMNAYGRADMRGIVQSISKKDYLKYITYAAEKAINEMYRMSKLKNTNVSKQVMLVDMDQLSMRSVSDRRVVELGLETIKMSEANYPEALRRVFVINAPKLFTVVFSMIKSILHETTLNKFRVYGSDSETWKAALLEEIEADQLPAYYGGTMTDPDGNPMCLTKCVAGGEVPKSYYIIHNKPQPKEDMENATIASGAVKKVEVIVPKVNSTLRWQFMTEEADVGFHIYYTDNGKKVDAVPWERVNSHLVMEEGMTVCTQVGTYIVEFDNSFSYLRSKKVWYTVAVNEPTIAAGKQVASLASEVEKNFNKYYFSAEQAVNVKW